MQSVVLHDECAFPGGGERVAAAAAQALGASIITASFSSQTFPADFFHDTPVHDLDALSGPFSRLPFAKTILLWRAFSRLQKHDADVALFSGNFAPLAADAFEGKKIFYCHTPPRPVFDLREHYDKQTPPILRPLHRLLLSAYRTAYLDAVAKMDRIFANSHNVAARLKNHLGIDADVLYPPCDTTFFTWRGQDDFYLSTARVDTLKRVDLIVEAFMRMPEKRLVVLSGGSELARLRRTAASAGNISFTGWVNEETLRELMGRCIAAVYIPKDEDFGISPVESMAAGKPVIGVDEGGLKETVRNGETGLLLPAEPSVEDLIQAVQEVTPARAMDMRAACEAAAAAFDTQIFQEKLKAVALGEWD